MIVIVLASLAIATAVALMVIPPTGTAKADSRRLAPPPAPERMETSPLPPALPPPSSNGNVVPPKSSSIDPWTDPNAQPPPPPVDDDDDTLDPDDPSADPFANGGGSNGGTFDPFGSLGGNPLAQLGNLGIQGEFMVSVVGHVCTRAKSCGNTQLTQVCDVVDQLGQGGKAPSCASGQRCLSKIDQLDCDLLSVQNMLGRATLLQDCMDAISSQNC